MRKPPTMIEVAQAAGVSPMTVSRALRPDGAVSPETRSRILRVAEDLGYVLDQTASGLRSQRTGFVAVTIPSINNANFADTLRGLSDALRHTQLQILMGTTDYADDEEERLIAGMLRRRPEAIVVTGGVHTDRTRAMLRNGGVPVVEIWDLPAEPLGHVVGFSNAAAGRLMAEHLIASGHTRIGFIGGDDSRDSRGLDRRRGFLAALAEHGLDAARLVAAGPPPVTLAEGAVSMRQMLARWPDTQAVMCVSDLSAFGALCECQRAGIAVPGQISIGGFGDYDIAQNSVPTMTTIDVSANLIGRMAAETVIDLLAGREVPALKCIEPRLIRRGTT
ncbi:MAG: LacI family DNA-binding transcriptional regulator [Gemmobacter sp.]